MSKVFFFFANWKKVSCTCKVVVVVSFFLLIRSTVAVFYRSRYFHLVSSIRASLRGGGVPQIGEVTRLGGVARLSI